MNGFNFNARLRKLEGRLSDKPRFGDMWKVHRLVESYLEADRQAEAAGLPPPERPALSPEWELDKYVDPDDLPGD